MLQQLLQKFERGFWFNYSTYMKIKKYNTSYGTDFNKSVNCYTLVTTINMSKSNNIKI